MNYTFKTEQYRLVLNYDTNGRKCLTFEQRHEIHAAISYMLSHEREKHIKRELYVKIIAVLIETKEQNYKEKEVRYTELKNGKVIEINNEL